MLNKIESSIDILSRCETYEVFIIPLVHEYKYKNGIGRYVFREAMKGILDDQVRNRLDKDGATIPTLPTESLDQR